MASCGLFSADEPPPEVKMEEAFVTLATNDVYAFGALVLAYSLRDVHTSKKLLVLVTRDVGVVMKHLLSQVFDDIQQVTLLCGKDPLGCPDRHRDNVRASFTKLHCWRLANLSKGVFLDADTLVLANCDELFQWREFSAAPLRGWPDLFDTGVFVFQPSVKTHGLVMKFARDTASFDGVDRGILNDLFGREWKADLQLQLPFTYNLQATSGTQFFDKAFLHYGACNAKIVHFWGSHKPWTQVYDWTTSLVHTKRGCPHRIEHLQKWWDVFTSRVQPRLARHPCGDGSQKPGLVCRDEICRSRGLSFSSDDTSSTSQGLITGGQTRPFVGSKRWPNPIGLQPITASLERGHLRD
ncbi:glycogenin-1 [Ixodes scapularis]